MLKIVFLKIGKRNQKILRLVVRDKRRGPTSRKFVEELGFRNPFTKEVFLRRDRIKYWLSVGAKPTESVRELLKKEKILT